MNGMSPEANQLVNAGREAFSPTDADRARLMTALTGTATLSLVAAIGAALWLAIRVYRAGVLLYGQRPTLEMVVGALRGRR